MQINATDFTGKHILVVGGSSGIGNGIAHGFNARGADVEVWGTRPHAADYADTDGSSLAELSYRQVDVTDFNHLDALDPGFERLDTLILCQGTVRYGQEEFARPGWDAVMDVNINSVMHTATKLRPLLAAARGSLIIVSSVAGFNASKGNPAYSASKHGAVGLTKTLGQAWARDGIRVNGLAPGFVETKLTRITTEDKARREGALRAIPQRRFGTPADMAGVALFLASPLASYVTGQTIIVDGGLSLS